jgi:hypothetical protein
VDDACRAFYSPAPADCGVGLTTGFEGQIMHQPAWSLFDAIRLAGVEPTADGYRIDPQLPVRTFSLSLPDVGVAYSRTGARGYLVSAANAGLIMQVRAPGGGRWRVRIDGRTVSSRSRRGMLVFSLRAVSGRRADWQIQR